MCSFSSRSACRGTNSELHSVRQTHKSSESNKMAFSPGNSYRDCLIRERRTVRQSNTPTEPHPYRTARVRGCEKIPIRHSSPEFGRCKIIRPVAKTRSRASSGGMNSLEIRNFSVVGSFHTPSASGATPPTLNFTLANPPNLWQIHLWLPRLLTGDPPQIRLSSRNPPAPTRQFEDAPCSRNCSKG